VTNTFFTFLAGAIYLAIIYVLVRPNSKGPTIIDNVFTALSDLVRGVTGQTYNSATGKWEAPQ
jgi:hypothetical protein